MKFCEFKQRMLVNDGVNSREVNICLSEVPEKESPARWNSNPQSRSTDCHRIGIIRRRGDSLEMLIASWKVRPRSFLSIEDRYKVTVPLVHELQFLRCTIMGIVHSIRTRETE